MYLIRILNYWRQITKKTFLYAVFAYLIMLFFGSNSLLATAFQEPPDSAVVVGHMGGWGYGAAVKDGFVLFSQGNCLSTFQKKAGGLSRIGFLMLPAGGARNLTVSGDQLFFSFFGAGHMGTVDVSDPYHPAGYYDIHIDEINETINEIRTLNGFAYVLSGDHVGMSHRLTVVDVSDPSAINSTASLEIDLSAFIPVGDYGYALLGDANESAGNQLAVFDLSDSSDIHEIARFDFDYAERLGTDGTY